MNSNSQQRSKRERFSSNRTRPISARKSAPKRKFQSTIDPAIFTKRANTANEAKFVSSCSIANLPVHQQIVNNLLGKGYVTPTEIQEKTIGSILKGNDLMGIAQTGTGKTGAFLIPLVNNLVNQQADFQVLVVAPTRELAVQTNTEFLSIAKGLGMQSSCFIGGTSVSADIQKLRKASHFVIGTPGRLIDMVRQGALNLGHFNTLVLDEFDRLLDMGFLNDIEQLISGMVNRKQTILFSATEEKGQKKIVDRLLTNPEMVRVHNGTQTADTVDQEIVSVKLGEKKMDILLGMIRDDTFKKVLVFAETKRWVSRICKDLRKSGIKVDEIHGDKSQNYRLKALNSFRDNSIQVLVATDVAARGLDISQVSHVINYEQPRNIDSYIHRIGRTGRAGQLGKAITFVN